MHPTHDGGALISMIGVVFQEATGDAPRTRWARVAQAASNAVGGKFKRIGRVVVKASTGNGSAFDVAIGVAIVFGLPNRRNCEDL